MGQCHILRTCGIVSVGLGPLAPLATCEALQHPSRPHTQGHVISGPLQPLLPSSTTVLISVHNSPHTV